MYFVVSLNKKHYSDNHRSKFTICCFSMDCCDSTATSYNPLPMLPFHGIQWIMSSRVKTKAGSEGVGRSCTRLKINCDSLHSVPGLKAAAIEHWPTLPTSPGSLTS